MNRNDPARRKLQVTNESASAGTVCIFQTLRKPLPDPLTLAWMTKAMAPASRALFDWEERFELHWREREPAITSWQSLAVDPDGTNDVTLTYDRRRGFYAFRNAVTGPKPGKLYLRQGGDIPLRRAQIGLGMDGRALQFVDAQPNVTFVVRTAVRYWIAFGSFTEGEAIDLATLRGSIAELPFSGGIRALEAVFRSDHHWQIRPR